MQDDSDSEEEEEKNEVDENGNVVVSDEQTAAMFDFDKEDLVWRVDQ